MSDPQAQTSSITPITPTTPYSDLPEWLSPKEVAAYLRLNRWTVYEGCKRGDIPYKPMGKKLKLIPKRYLRDAQETVSTSSPLSPRVAKLEDLDGRITALRTVLDGVEQLREARQRVER